MDGKKLNTPNDIIMKSDGIVYFTDPSNGIRNVGMESDDVQKYVDYEAVYKLDLSDGSLTLLADDYINCNGLCFSPDESLLYIMTLPAGTFGFTMCWRTGQLATAGCLPNCSTTIMARPTV